MSRWGMTPPEPGQTWGDFLEFGLTLDQDEDTTLYYFPFRPKLSHVGLKLAGGDGSWLACFNPATIRVAWVGGLPTIMTPRNSFAEGRARGARHNLKAGIGVVNELEQIVHYPPQEPRK